MSTTANWTNFSDVPFGTKHCASSPALINNNIILSPVNNNNLYKFNTKSENWSNHHFGNYRLEHHAQCLSNDGKKLYLFQGTIFQKILLIINIVDTLNDNEIIEKRTNMIIYGYIASINILLYIPRDIILMIASYFGEYHEKKIIKQMKHSLFTGKYPSIIADPQYNNIIHIIGGKFNNNHYTMNIDNGHIKKIHTFHGSAGLKGPGIVNIPHKQQWYLIHGSMPIHIFDFKERTWNNTKIEMPENHHIECFGYITSPDFKYILLFSGDNMVSYNESDVMLIFDIENMIYNISNIKTPKCWDMNAVITRSGDIHLFGLKKHYKMNVKQIYDIDIDFS